MNKLFPLSKEMHTDKYWTKARDWSFASGKSLVPIVLLELSGAIGEMPLAFVPHQDAYHLVAVLGVAPEKSLAVAPDGSWRPGHYPLLLATYPFVLVDGQDDNQLVAVDEGSGLISDDPSKGQPFFNAHGEPSDIVSRVVENLKRVAAGRLATRNAVKALAEAGVLEPWQLTVGNTKMEGLYRVSEKSLRSLEPGALKGLLDKGALTAAYGQLFSMSRISLLNQWAKDEPVQKDPGFTLTGDGDLNIDWDKV